MIVPRVEPDTRTFADGNGSPVLASVIRPEIVKTFWAIVGMLTERIIASRVQLKVTRNCIYPSFIFRCSEIFVWIKACECNTLNFLLSNFCNILVHSAKCYPPSSFRDCSHHGSPASNNNKSLKSPSLDWDPRIVIIILCKTYNARNLFEKFK